MLVRSGMFFRQIRGRGDNFSYLIANENTKEAAIVDPSFNSDLIIELARREGLKVNYVIATHHHTDHTAGVGDIKSAFGSKVVAHELSNIEKDVSVIDGSVLQIGGIIIKVIHTPGHTKDGICLLVEKILLTGDTLFVGECGRTDMPDGSSEDMYDSLFNKLMRLDGKIKIYPGHDYGGMPYSTIGEERQTNYTLEPRTLEEFVKFMNEP